MQGGANPSPSIPGISEPAPHQIHSYHLMIKQQPHCLQRSEFRAHSCHWARVFTGSDPPEEATGNIDTCSKALHTYQVLTEVKVNTHA